MFKAQDVALCYLDESGDEFQPSSEGSGQIFAIGGLVVSAQQSDGLLMGFLKLKQRMLPELSGSNVKLSDLIRHEVKGSTLRRGLRESNKSKRAVVAFLDEVVALLESHQVNLVGQVHIKSNNALERDAYAKAVHAIVRRIDRTQSDGRRLLVVMDSRTKSKNIPTVHRLATQKFKAGSNHYQRLLETPLFGHSDAHPLLQLADIVTSVFLVVVAAVRFLGTYETHDGYEFMCARYSSRLHALQGLDLAQESTAHGTLKVKNHLDPSAGGELFVNPLTRKLTF